MIECKLMFVDDDEMIRRVMERGLTKEVSNVTCVSSLAEAMAKLDEEMFDVIVTDLCISDMPNTEEHDGLKLIRAIRERSPETEIIMQTGFGSNENVERALRAGAFDYLEKPYKPERLVRMVERALEQRNMRLELSTLRQQVAFDYGFDGLVGSTEVMRSTKERIVQAADSDLPILLTGPAGSGKAHVARTIHHHSRRRRETMITFDAAATAQRLLDSELFGLKENKGGHTTRRTTGWYRQAEGGSLLIRNIEQLPLATQAELLNAIDHTGEWANVDVRVIATTSKNLASEVASGRFMAQLSQRLTDMSIALPPLSQRSEDIPDLAQRFLRTLNETAGAASSGQSLSPAALEKLLDHNWPGNVSELQNTVRRAKALAQHEQINVDDIFFSNTDRSKSRSASESTLPPATRGSLEMTYRARILKSLEDNSWNFSQTAQELGIGRTTLWRKVKKYNLKRELVADQTQ